MAAKFINNYTSEDGKADLALEIREDIKQLELKLSKKKKALRTLQQNCEHYFIEHGLVRTCQKCLLKESIYY